MCAQRRLRWESSLCAQWVAKDPWFLHADSEDSDQTGMPRLIWAFAGRTQDFVGFVVILLIFMIILWSWIQVLPCKVEKDWHHIIIVTVLNAGLNFLLPGRVTLLWMLRTLENSIMHVIITVIILNIQTHGSQQLGRIKRICVFEHSVMTNFNCSCPAIQMGQGSGFLSEGSSWLTACISEQRRFWRDCADAQARLNLRCSHRR